MQAKGWLERRDDSSDRRVYRLHLTEKAERLHAAIWPLAEATVDEALGDLSPEDRRSLATLMTRVKAKLQALAEHDPAQDMQLQPEPAREGEARAP
jgi:DNA-binding MarR family transcriptional regulator